MRLNCSLERLIDLDRLGDLSDLSDLDRLGGLSDLSDLDRLGDLSCLGLDIVFQKLEELGRSFYRLCGNMLLDFANQLEAASDVGLREVGFVFFDIGAPYDGHANLLAARFRLHVGKQNF